uniref:ribosomal protein L24 n=1 Tax=Nemalion vermiculare TaxID=935621 RepID=UPI00257B6A71|nr:ribosomal protein L24 [Nemalion vermiculare]WGV34438.1 ribosomal protein L24 [Nemalion vermiculare]
MSKKLKRKKIHVKVGDTVKIISGYHKGKMGEIIKTFRLQGKVIVKDVNMKTKHIRPKQEGESGQIIRQEAPIDSSNVMLYSTELKIASRYQKIKNSAGKYERKLIKSNRNS